MPSNSSSNASNKSKSKEIADEYVSSLSDLTINSKPLINMLTMLAEDNIEHAPAIVHAVEAHLQKVRSDIKLPVLYLIDSIVKNVNRVYLTLFTQNIVNTFCSVFEKVDETTRASMWKLRQTWSEVFPSKKLYALDVRVQSIDPAWPIVSPPASNMSTKSIHVNPRFLSMQQQQAQKAQPVPQTAAIQRQVAVSPVIAPLPDTALVAEASMREQLLEKQKELLELQKKKIEIELLQAKATLAQQQRQYTIENPSQAEYVVMSSSEKLAALDKQLNAATSHLKSIEEQYPAAAASLMKPEPKNSAVKIAPASIAAVEAAKSMAASRDPRLKLVSSSSESAALIPEQHPILQDYDFLRQKQNKVSLRHAETSSEKSENSLVDSMNNFPNSKFDTHNIISNKQILIDNNKRAKDITSNQNNKKDHNIQLRSNIINNSLSNDEKYHVPQVTSSNNNVNESVNINQSKSSSTSSSSTLATVAASSSSTTSKSSSTRSLKSSSSSSSSRKLGSKSRSNKSTTSSPSKQAKLDNSSPQKSLSPTPSSSSQKSSRTSSSSKSKSSKSASRKRSPSPLSSSYRIPRRSANLENNKPNSSINNNLQGLDEEEQSGSLIISPPHPPAQFKEIRSSTRLRNYVRRNNKESPEKIIANTIDIIDKDIIAVVGGADAAAVCKDEDLRTPLAAVAATSSNPLEAKEDMDLRILPGASGKRQSSEIVESNTLKKSKAEKFDELFGNEDVDLRTLTNPKAGRPPTPPPPVISCEEGKDSWAKLKTPIKNDREGRSSENKPPSDRSRDRLGRPRLYSKSDDQKDRRRGPLRDFDKNERNPDRNIEIIMKQAAEQLNQNQITRAQYNKLIQDVLHMSEDQKLRAAQRKEKEIGMIIWEKNNVDVSDRQHFNNSDDNIRSKEHGMHPRSQNGPNRWNQPWQQPWAIRPPSFQGPFGPDFRQVGPWQNRAPFGPMRPDFHQYHGGFNPRLGPMGPNGPLLLPNGPLNSMGAIPPLPMPPIPPMLLNNALRPDLNKRLSSPSTPGATNNTSGNNSNSNGTNSLNNQASGVNNNAAELENTPGCGGIIVDNEASLVNLELPPADTKLIEEIDKDTMKSINIDNFSREIRYYGNIGIVFMHWDDPRDIGFQDGTRRVIIDGKDSINCDFNADYKEFTYEGEVHRIKLGGPTRELYVDDKWYECYFGGRPVTVDLSSNKKINIKLEGPLPQVKIGPTKRSDLVVGKINLIINARTMVPVFLDSKPQKFEIDGIPCTLEFIDALQTVLLNGRPFKVEFGGLPKPIYIREEKHLKKHFIRFSVLPRGFKAGYVRIAGMKGEGPMDEASISGEISNQKLFLENANVIDNSISLPLEPDSNSQDGSALKPDLQLDVLSSVVPSAMAPSSGLSYQAEPVENIQNPPPLALPLNLNELFQRLVETGIVPHLTETKKQEEEEKKEPEVVPVTFDKPETIKIKQPAIYIKLYTGMQCSSCGARFAPELAQKYANHLDWHFRQNRRERDSAKKAHSRPWFYDISDWTQYEEIEDLEDRAQSWFETEKQSAETENAAADDLQPELLQPSVPSGSDPDDSKCQVCHDVFEQFYNEEKEEWHYRPVVSFDNKNFHPLCLEDHKKALEKSALALEETLAELEDEKKKDEELEDKEKEDEKMEVEGEIENENNDVNENEEVQNKVVAEEESEKIETENKTDETAMDEESEVVQIIEPEKIKQIEIIEEIVDDDDDEALIQEDGSEGLNQRKGNDTPVIFDENIKIKEEPIDEAETGEIVVTDPTPVDTTQVEVKSTIDGNVELDTATPAIPAAPSKPIKINISKPLAISTKEVEELKVKESKDEEVTKEEETPTILLPASIKPALQGKKLSNLPRVEKGEELSALCSIM